MGLKEILTIGIHYFSQFLIYAIFLRVIISWFVGRGNPITNMLDVIVEPILTPVRNMIYKSPLGGPGMGLDFAPIIAYILIGLVSRLLIAVVLMFF